MARWLFNLAKKYNKPNKWLYGLLAAITYYGVGILSVFLIMAFNLFNTEATVDSLENRMVYTIMALPFGIGAVALLHYLLKRSWSKELENNEGLLDDSVKH